MSGCNIHRNWEDLRFQRIKNKDWIGYIKFEITNMIENDEYTICLVSVEFQFWGHQCLDII